MSGRFGIRSGVCSNVSKGADFKIRKKSYGGPEADNEMFMRQLRKNGYDTISISNFADRHNAWYFMCGFGEFYTPNLKSGYETAKEVNEVAVRWLENNKDKENYFLHINYWDTHRVYKMDEKWSERFKDSPVKQTWPDEETIKGHQDIKGPFTATGQFKNNISDFPLMPGSISNRADFEKMITAYDTSIAYVDHHVGEIIDHLRKNDMWDDTVLIVSSDHGDAFGEHGIYSDHVCADECIHNVPLIIKWPDKVIKEHRNDSLLYNVDLAPTVCDILGFSIPEDWDGVSFKESLNGAKRPGRKYLVWDHALYTVQRAVRTKDHLMVRTYDDFGYMFDPVELYDMRKDKYQIENIAALEPDTVKECDAYLTEWIFDQHKKGHVIPDPIIEVLKERQA